MATPSKTVGTQLLALQSVASVVISSVQDVSTISGVDPWAFTKVRKYWSGLTFDSVQTGNKTEGIYVALSSNATPKPLLINVFR